MITPLGCVLIEQRRVGGGVPELGLDVRNSGALLGSHDSARMSEIVEA
ncbi:MAG: hypothetical protein WAV45_02005 [Propionibacteriaceae bacterium]